MAYAVVSVIGHDRPGFVRELSALALAQALNIEDTRATGLGNEFAVLMGVTGDDAAIDALDAALADRASATDMAYVMRRSQHNAERSRSRKVRASVLAMDHPGIVHSVSGFFADRNLNIEDMNTESRPAPHTGTPMFDLRMLVALGIDTDIEQLAKAFRTFCAEEDLDGSMEATP